MSADDRNECRYCGKWFVVASLRAHHERNRQCQQNSPEAIPDPANLARASRHRAAALAHHHATSQAGNAQ